ncbi:hypothetical protein BJX99DRAFT_254022 [Aspergillus californicus]
MVFEFPEGAFSMLQKYRNLSYHPFAQEEFCDLLFPDSMISMLGEVTEQGDIKVYDHILPALFRQINRIADQKKLAQARKTKLINDLRDALAGAIRGMYNLNHPTVGNSILKQTEETLPVAIYARLKKDILCFAAARGHAGLLDVLLSEGFYPEEAKVLLETFEACRNTANYGYILTDYISHERNGPSMISWFNDSDTNRDPEEGLRRARVYVLELSIATCIRYGYNSLIDELLGLYHDVAKQCRAGLDESHWAQMFKLLYLDSFEDFFKKEIPPFLKVALEGDLDRYMWSSTTYTYRKDDLVAYFAPWFAKRLSKRRDIGELE